MKYKILAVNNNHFNNECLIISSMKDVGRKRERNGEEREKKFLLLNITQLFLAFTGYEN